MNYNDVPYEMRPMSPWKYFGLNILYAIPIIGFIFLICHAIGSRNVNKRNYARSFFCIVVVALVIFAIFFFSGTFGNLITSLADSIKA